MNILENSILTVSYMNIHGQSKLPILKQLQIQDFIKYNKIDVLQMQEINIDDETFSECEYLSNNFNLISNNSETKYGTASLVRSDIEYRNVRCDTSGRAIVFEIGCVTFGNFYAHSGTDGNSRANREAFCGETIPNLLINSQPSGCLGGDLNMIIDKRDATNNPESKMSPTFKRLVQSFSWRDSFRTLHPSAEQFSRYYSSTRGDGATRIDRCYHYGDININSAAYLPLAFSDHHAHVVSIILPNPFARLMCPESYPSFRIKAEVVQDEAFQSQLAEAMLGWQAVRSYGLDTLQWWEHLVKPGVKKLAQKRGREMSREKHEELNLLRLRQGYLNRKLMNGQNWRLTELKAVHVSIENWYSNESNKIKFQSQASEYQQEEKVRIYHHDLHRKRIKKSFILKLETAAGTLEGHQACADYLEQTVEELLLHPVQLSQSAQDALLAEVDPVFTEADNELLLKQTSKEEILDTLSASNQHAAPGTDGLTSFFYKQCFSIIGESLTDVVSAVFSGDKPTLSQRTSKMVFGSKPKKASSKKPGDKRRISLLNCDFKTISGIESARFKKTATRTLSPYQLVAGDDRRIHHGINLARDAIQAASKLTRTGCGIADTDYQAAFDFLVMSWVFMVLKKKGVSGLVIKRLKNLYEDNLSVIVVNNIEGKCIPNRRLSLRQGDVPSMFFFAYGIDPLISYLERRLAGILICSLPVLGPAVEGSASVTLPPLEERYRVVSYADDLKPAVVSMEEFSLVNSASALFEAASGCRLHRDPASQKCKFLPLGRWRRTLQQEDLPLACQYMVLSDHLDMVGVQLHATWTQTRKSNGDIVQQRVSSTVNPWRAGKFMPLTMRPWSINCYVLSKVWFKCGSVDLRVSDISAINSSVKSWLYADLLVKPSEAVMCRPASHGGLQVTSAKYKAQAILIKTFLETAATPKFRHSLLHSILFRFHVLGDTSLPDPGYLPYYPPSFFQTIRHVHLETPLNILSMTTGQWVRILTEDGLTMEMEGDQHQYIPCRAELKFPSNNWTVSWTMCRLNGLGSDLASFNFKLLHDLLITRQRLHQITPAATALCSHCDAQAEEDLQHALVDCGYNNGAGQTLLNIVHTSLPDMTTASLLRLELTSVEIEDELSTVTFISAFLKEIWDKRHSRSRITSFDIRATIEARCLLLRKSRWRNSIATLTNMINSV